MKHVEERRTERRISLSQVQAALISRLREVARLHLCEPAVQGWFTTDRDTLTISSAAPAKVGEWPAIPLSNLEHIDEARLTLSVTSDRGGLREYSIQLRGRRRIAGSPSWYARVDLDRTDGPAERDEPGRVGDRSRGSAPAGRRARLPSCQQIGGPLDGAGADQPVAQERDVARRGDRCPGRLVHDEPTRREHGQEPLGEPLGLSLGPDGVETVVAVALQQVAQRRLVGGVAVEEREGGHRVLQDPGRGQSAIG